MADQALQIPWSFSRLLSRDASKVSRLIESLRIDSIEQVKTDKEFYKCADLVAREYARRKYMPYSPESVAKVLREQEKQNQKVFAVKMRESFFRKKIIATVGLIQNIELPIDEIFPEAREHHFGGRSQMVSLANDQSLFAGTLSRKIAEEKFQKIVEPLMSISLMHCLGTPNVFATAHPRHACFYEGKAGYVALANGARRTHPEFVKAPAMGFYLDFDLGKVNPYVRDVILNGLPYSLGFVPAIS